MPKRNEAIKLTIEVLFISEPTSFLKLFCINILSINPKVLPIKMITNELKSKFTSSTSPL